MNKIRYITLLACALMTQEVVGQTYIEKFEENIDDCFAVRWEQDNDNHTFILVKWSGGRGFSNNSGMVSGLILHYYYDYNGSRIAKTITDWSTAVGIVKDGGISQNSDKVFFYVSKYFEGGDVAVDHGHIVDRLVWRVDIYPKRGYATIVKQDSNEAPRRVMLAYINGGRTTKTGKQMLENINTKEPCPENTIKQNPELYIEHSSPYVNGKLQPSVLVSWFGGVLQSSKTVSGNWIDVDGGKTSGGFHRATSIDDQLFFRIKPDNE